VKILRAGRTTTIGFPHYFFLMRTGCICLVQRI